MEEKQIIWMGSSLADLVEFPENAKREAGYQLNRVQCGLEPDRYKPYDNVGAGTKEIIISEDGGQFRVMYVAKFPEGVYVLHSFQKKTQKTSDADKDIVRKRYKRVVAERVAEKADGKS